MNCRVYNVLRTMYYVQCTTYNVRSTMYTVHCTMYSVQCTLYNLLTTIENKKFNRVRNHKTYMQNISRIFAYIISYSRLFSGTSNDGINGVRASGGEICHHHHKRVSVHGRIFINYVFNELLFLGYSHR